jgi:hypothetical protein
MRQRDLELEILPSPPPSAGITGVHNHARLKWVFFFSGGTGV